MHLIYNKINLHLEEYYAFNAKELDEENGK